MSLPSLNAFWFIWFQLQWTCAILRADLLGLIGIRHPTSIALLALFAIVGSVFLAVLCIAVLIGSVSETINSQPSCVHGTRNGGIQRGQKFCPACARDQDVVQEIHKKMKAEKIRRGPRL